MYDSVGKAGDFKMTRNILSLLFRYIHTCTIHLHIISRVRLIAAKSFRDLETVEGKKLILTHCNTYTGKRKALPTTITCLLSFTTNRGPGGPTNYTDL